MIASHFGSGVEPVQTVLHNYINEGQAPVLWLNLYYIDNLHFKVLILEKDDLLNSFFANDSLPASLQTLLL